MNVKLQLPKSGCFNNQTVLGARRHSLFCVFMLEIIEDLLGNSIFIEIELCPGLKSVEVLKRVSSWRAFHLVLCIVEKSSIEKTRDKMRGIKKSF